MGYFQNRSFTAGKSPYLEANGQPLTTKSAGHRDSHALDRLRLLVRMNGRRAVVSLRVTSWLFSLHFICALYNLYAQPSRALNWTRLSCHKFVANQVRLGLFVLAYNLGNFMRRLALPEAMKHWSLNSLQTRMIKTGGRLVRYARRLVFQLAEVLVSREMLCGILERIGQLRLAPG